MSQENQYTIEDVKREAQNFREDKNKGELIQIIIFKIGNEEYGLSIDQIKEIVLTPNIARVPHVPDYIKGVANIRGNIISIVDLKQKFGLEDSNDAVVGGNNYTLVLESEEMKVGVLVEHVPNTLSISRNDIDPYSTLLNGDKLETSFIIGVAKSENRMIILLDMFKLLSSEISQMSNQNF